MRLLLYPPVWLLHFLSLLLYKQQHFVFIHTTTNNTMDLDALLSSIESKLRVPFATLDGPPDERLAEHLERLDKVVQLRLLVGLLQQENSSRTTTNQDVLLDRARNSSEPWVRILAGIVQSKVPPELTQTCLEIQQAVLDLADSNNDRDVDPTFVPYYHALVAPSLHFEPHFGVRREADILQVDLKLEQAKDEQAAPLPVAVTATTTTTTAATTTTTTAQPPKKTPKSSGSSLFLLPTKKKPHSTALHVRKKGASQSLVGKGRRLTQKSSKMVLLEDAPPAESNAGTKRQRLATTTAMNKKAKRTHPPPVEPPAAPAAAANTLITGALSAYQQQAAPRQTNWQQLLQEKNNKLTDADRQRIEDFYVHRRAPDDSTTVYKLKLHEERSTVDGQPVKETYYLELDYTNFTSKQSKKTKRY